MTINKHVWVNLFSLGQTEGFVYFKAYIDQASNRVSGWVTRTGLEEPYGYNVYYIDASGEIVTGTRGMWKHADWAVQGGVASK